MLEEKTKTNLVSSIVAALAFFLLPIKSNAVPAAPVIHTLSQSDGSVFEARYKCFG